jgi:membrane protein DedA with SNARE-associated domain
VNSIEQSILHFISDYGYWGIMISLILGIVGLPLPDEVLMMFAGYMVQRGELSLIMTLMVSFIASLTGMSISFWIGSKFGYPLLHRFGPKLHISRERLERAEIWFLKYGKFAVFIGYFLPGIRHITAYLSGIGHWKYSTFITNAAYGALVWVITFVSIGYYLGQDWLLFSQMLHRNLLVVVTVALIAAALLLAYQWVRRRKII